MPPRTIGGRGRGGHGHNGRGRRHRVVRLEDVGQPHRNPSPSLSLEGMDEHELPEASESVDDTTSQRDNVGAYPPP